MLWLPLIQETCAAIVCVSIAPFAGTLPDQPAMPNAVMPSEKFTLGKLIDVRRNHVDQAVRETG